MVFLSWWNDGGGFELQERMFKGYNVMGIRGSCALLPPEIFAHTNKPINSLADMKGLKIRSAGVSGEVLKRIGASVVSMPGGEVYEAMKRGVIDAFEYSTAAVNWAQGFQEVAKYAILSGVRAPMEFNTYGVNRGAWEKLPPDLQTIVAEVMRGETMKAWAESQLAEAKAIENFRKYGTLLPKLPKDAETELIKFANQYYDEQSAKDPFAAEIIQSQRNYLNLVGQYQKLVSWGN